VTVVDDIKARLDILEVVGQRVPLQRSGRSYKGNCPFHQERTPSFHVFPDRQSWRCFGACATGGDAITFVMRAENMEFGEAIRQLARQVGLPMPERQGARSDPAAYRINEAACAYFQRTLASTQGAEARAYMERRGLDRASTETFQLGLAPLDGESLRSHLMREGFEPGQLVAAGVVRESDDGQQRDLFRGRLMIPIRDGDGRLAGFGGRALDDSQPKYLNSPQGEVFDKSRILYAMDRARDDIRKNGAVIVEGYMDAIAAHRAGFHNVVASMGTALTEPQVNAIRRLTGRVTMALDQDAAGQQATLRSLESSWRIYHSQVARQSAGATMLQRPELPEIRIAALPTGQDPDDVIRRSPEEWRGLVENARPLLEFVISAMSASIDLATPQGKAAVADQVSRLIFAVQDAPQQDFYLQMLAQKLEVPQETLRASISRPSAPRRPRASQNRQPPVPAQEEATSSPFAILDRDPLEEYCLSLLMRYPDLGEYAESLTPELFLRPENREIFANYLDFSAVSEDGNDEYVEGVWETVPPGVREQVQALRDKSLPPMDILKRRRAITDVVVRLEERSIRQQKKDEQDRFTDSAEELNEDDHRSAVALNERLRQNQSQRPSLRARR
jgi:DNA primase